MSQNTTVNSETFSVDELIKACSTSGKYVGTSGQSETVPEGPGNSNELGTMQFVSESEDVTIVFHGDAAVEIERTLHVPTNNVVEQSTEVTKRKRKKVNKTKWQTEIRKRKRMTGEHYEGREGKKRNARKLGPPCSSTKCQGSKLRNCEKFSEKERQTLFDQFWSMDWGEKQAHIKSMVDKIHPKQIKGIEKRSATFLYYLKLNGEKKQVCKALFRSTLDIKEKQLRNWLLSESTPKMGKRRYYPRVSRPRKEPSTPDTSIRNFLTSLPQLESHYCRQSTSKKFLEPVFRSKKDVYRLYESKCKESNEKPGSWSKFHQLFEKLNIGIYQPKKDRCDICCSHEVGNITKADILMHKEMKELARNEKQNDKEEAKIGNIHALCMDVQAVLISPKLTASALYYKTKLVVHNFTIYNLATHDVMCYLWDESEGQLVASVFASCLLRYLEKFKTDPKTVVIYSDGCANQNRNAVLSTALLNFAIETGITVIQKYLEKGHTQMEVDSVHSVIERKLKGRNILVPSDYIDICKTARVDKKLGPYDVTYMNHRDFVNFASKTTQRSTSIRPGKNRPGEPVVTDIRQIKYDPSGEIFFKLNHSDDWSPMPRKKEQNAVQEFPPLYDSRIPVTDRKFQDLQALLHVIPAIHHDFYNNLLH